MLIECGRLATLPSISFSRNRTSTVVDFSRSVMVQEDASCSNLLGREYLSRRWHSYIPACPILVMTDVQVEGLYPHLYWF